MEDEINIIDLLKVLNKYKFLIMTLVILAIAVSTWQGLSQPSVYEAEATVLVLQSKEEFSSNINNLFASFFGRSGQSSDTVLDVIIDSRILAVAVAQDLKQKGFLDEWLAKYDKKSKINGQGFEGIKASSSEEVIVGLVKGSVKSDLKGRLLRVTATSSDPKLVDIIANTYVKKLQEYSLKNSLGLSLQPLDPAVSPRFAVGRGGSKKIVFSGVVALIIGIMFAFFLNYIKSLSLLNNVNIKKESSR